MNQSANQSASSVEIKNKETMFGHPKGLFVLSSTEMWERFSYYGMRGLLILYLTKHFLFGDQEANSIYYSYVALVYALPLVGGFLADKYLGFKKAVTFGGILLCLGHLLMAYEGGQATYVNGEVMRDTGAVTVMYLALSLIAVGVGFLKPNISAVVSTLYDKNDPRRDSAFTIFYMGINLGSFLAFIIAGYLGENIGWSYGFGAAGIGMLVGLVTFLQGQKHLHGAGDVPAGVDLKKKVKGLSIEHWVYVSGIVMVLFGWALISYRGGFNLPDLAMILLVLSFVGISYYSLKQLNKEERDRMVAAMLFILFGVAFWTLFDQGGTSLNLFTDRVVDRGVSCEGAECAFMIPTTWFQALNPAYILILAIPFSIMWVKLSERGKNPSTPLKFGLGVLQAALGFAALIVGSWFPGEAGKVSMIWLFIAYFLHTTGELCLSPIGLSIVTRLSVTRTVGLMMGTWFVGSAAAQWTAEILSNLAAIDTRGATSLDSQIQVYSDAFAVAAVFGIVVAMIIFALTPVMKKLMHGVK